MVKKLSSLLVGDNVVSIDKMEEALQRQVIFGGRLGTNLLEMGVVDERELSQYLSRARGLPSADADLYTSFESRALGLLDVDTIEHLGAMPVRIHKDAADVLVTDGLDTEQVARLQTRTGYPIRQHIAPDFRFQQALQRFFERPCSNRVLRLLERFPQVMQTGQPQARIAKKTLERPLAVPHRRASTSAQGPPPGLGWTLEEMSAYLRDCYVRDVILTSLLGFAGGFAPRRMLLVVLHHRLQGYAADGQNIPPRDVLRRAKLPIQPEGSIERVCRGDTYYQGTPREGELHELYDTLNLTAPANCLLLPVPVGPRAALVLLLDHDAHTFSPSALEPLFMVINDASEALERIIRLTKNDQLPPEELRLPPLPARFQRATQPADHGDTPDATHAQATTIPALTPISAVEPPAEDNLDTSHLVAAIADAITSNNEQPSLDERSPGEPPPNDEAVQGHQRSNDEQETTPDLPAETTSEIFEFDALQMPPIDEDGAESSSAIEAPDIVSMPVAAFEAPSQDLESHADLHEEDDDTTNKRPTLTEIPRVTLSGHAHHVDQAPPQQTPAPTDGDEEPDASPTPQIDAPPATDSPGTPTKTARALPKEREDYVEQEQASGPVLDLEPTTVENEDGEQSLYFNFAAVDSQATAPQDEDEDGVADESQAADGEDAKDDSALNDDAGVNHEEPDDETPDADVDIDVDVVEDEAPDDEAPDDEAPDDEAPDVDVVEDGETDDEAPDADEDLHAVETDLQGDEDTTNTSADAEHTSHDEPADSALNDEESTPRVDIDADLLPDLEPPLLSLTEGELESWGAIAKVAYAEISEDREDDPSDEALESEIQALTAEIAGSQDEQQAMEAPTAQDADDEALETPDGSALSTTTAADNTALQEDQEVREGDLIDGAPDDGAAEDEASADEPVAVETDEDVATGSETDGEASHEDSDDETDDRAEDEDDGSDGDAPGDKAEDEVAEDEPADDDSAEDEPAEAEVAEAEPAEADPADDDSAEDEPAEPDSAEAEPAEAEPAEAEPAEAEPADELAAEDAEGEETALLEDVIDLEDVVLEPVDDASQETATPDDPQGEAQAPAPAALMDAHTIELELLSEEDPEYELNPLEEPQDSSQFAPETERALERWRPAVDKLFQNNAATREEGRQELLTSQGEALPALLERFPGPLTVDRYGYSVAHMPPINTHGPLLEVLLEMGDLVAPAVSALLDVSSIEVRFYAIFFFSRVRYAPIIPKMVERLFDKDNVIRQVARMILRSYRHTEGFNQVINDLRRVLSQGDAWHIEQAAQAAGALAEPLLIPALIDLANHPQRRVAEVTQRALQTLSFENFGNNTRRWQRWWERNASQDRSTWLVNALNHSNREIRVMAAQELRQHAGLLVNYSPDSPRRDRVRAQAVVAQYFQTL